MIFIRHLSNGSFDRDFHHAFPDPAHPQLVASRAMDVAGEKNRKKAGMHR
jgi:hypothetical protein